MSKHTEGPWSYWPNCTREGGMITQDETATHIAAPTVYATPGQTEANARLIAAAPDLLAFVEEFIEAWDNGMAGDSYLVRMAQKAYDKATGG